MPIFNNLEELDVWKSGMHLSYEVHAIQWPEISQINPTIIQEFRSVTLTIPREIARGFLKSNQEDFILHLTLAKEACVEASILSSLLHGLQFVEGSVNQKLQNHIVQLTHKIDLLLRYLKEQAAVPA